MRIITVWKFTLFQNHNKNYPEMRMNKLKRTGAAVLFLLFAFLLLSSSIAMYAVNNNGGWYDFGFVLGAGILFGGGSRASR
jgi:hypothetical protein